MIDLNFVIDGDRYLEMPWRLANVISTTGEKSYPDMMDVCSRFLADKDNKMYEIGEAQKILGEIQIGHILEAYNGVIRKINELAGKQPPLAPTTKQPSPDTTSETK